MKLATLSTLAVAASCAANAPEVKPTNVDLQTTQTRDALLAQLSSNHEGTQDNGDFIACSSINNKEDYAKRRAVIEVGYIACDHILDSCRVTYEAPSIILKKDGGTFSKLYYCDEDFSTHTTTCTAYVPIESTSVNSTDACVRVKTVTLDNITISSTPQTPHPEAPEQD